MKLSCTVNNTRLFVGTRKAISIIVIEDSMSRLYPGDPGTITRDCAFNFGGVGCKS